MPFLGEQKPVLIDVLSKQRKPKGRDRAQLWIEPRHENLPGSVWLPNVGLWELSPDLAEYFSTELMKLTGGDKSRSVVFYCDSNCWMSWNAAKRAMVELGYAQVYWYPDGVQGWKAAGQPTIAAGALLVPERTD